jgi:hypothetical protein
METQVSKMEVFEAKIKEFVKEFAEDLGNGMLTGYSFYGYDIKRDSSGFVMNTSPGLKMIVDGEEIRFGAFIKFERGGKTKDYAKMYVEYELSAGREHKIQYHDECSNNPSNKGSIHDISVTDKLFEILYQMTSQIYADSPMPRF